MPWPHGTGPAAETAVLLVDGIDGSGKTSFAGQLADAMHSRGVDTALMHVDDYRRPVAWDHPAGEAAVYWERYFDLAAVERDVAAACGEGRTVVLEGIFTLRLAGLGSAPLVYLEVDYEVAAERILRRDTAKGRTPAEVRHRIEQRYFPAQRRYRATYRPSDRAAILVDTTDPANLRLLRGDWSRLSTPTASALRDLLRLPPA